MATSRQNTTTYLSETVKGKWFTNIFEYRKIQQGEIQTTQGAKLVKIYFDKDIQKWGISVVGTPQGKKLPEEIELRFPTTDGDEYTFSAKKVQQKGSPYCGGSPPPPPLISAWGQPQPFKQSQSQPQQTQAPLPPYESAVEIYKSMKATLSEEAELQETATQLKRLLSTGLMLEIEANLKVQLEKTEGKLKQIPDFSEREATLFRFLKVFCEPDDGEEETPEEAAEGEEEGGGAADTEP
jgi:hypothetical protein